MATPLEKVKNLMTESNLCYFTVTHNASILYQQTEELTASEAANKLIDFVDGLDYPHVDVKLSDKSPSDKSKGGRFVNLTHRIKLVDAPARGESAGGTMSLLREIAELKTQIVEDKYKSLMEKLEDKIDKLKNDEKNPMQEAALNMLMNMFSGQAQIAAPTAASLAGHNMDIQNIAPQNQRERLKKALSKIKLTDPNYIETLEMIAQLAEHKPGVYNTSIPLLKSQL